MIKQKILTFLCAALMSVGMWADDGTCGPNLTWNLSGGVLTISGTGAMTNWSFESKAPWYFDSSDIKSVTIGNGVTSIGNFAFFDCTGMTSVTIGNSVTSIGEAAFEHCTSLTSITIPSSVTSIGKMAFYQCGLTSITIPGSVTSIGEGAFTQCFGLTSITIPNSVTSIGTGAFAACYGLTSMAVASGNTNYDSRDNCKAIIEKSSNTLIAGCKNTIIPNSVTSIGIGAFFGCFSLESITIPTSVTSIGQMAFQYCYALTSITIPNSVTSIGESAFASCALTSVTIGNSVTSIGKGAFAECTALTSIEIPNSVTSIGQSAFSYCEGLTSVTIGNSVTSIGADAFNGCTAVTDVYCYPNAANLTWNEADCNDFKASKATSCHVPSNQLSAYQSKFNNVVNVTFVGDLPASAPTNPSGSCGANLSWEFDPSNGTLTITGTGAMDDFDYAEHQVPWLSSIDGITSVIIPDGVTRIGNCAFYACTALTSIEIPGSVTSIGDEAFSYCSLASVTVNATTPPTLGTDAFAGTAEGLKIYVPARSVDDYKAAWAAYADKITTPTYTVTLKEGTEDADNWTITPPEAKTTGVAEGTEVKATYSGTKLVKSVKAVKTGPKLNLATVTTDTTVEDGYTLTGTLGANVKISIADGATVTLLGLTINGVNNDSYQWAGINCLGDATIILSGTNTVKGFHGKYPGIHVPQNKTVTIQGSGSLTASSNGFGCGIGGGMQINCGNIVIAGGTITATGGGSAAGIGGGSGNQTSCGTISITGGTVNATGGVGAAGIGGGSGGSCGNISITGGTITATGGTYAAGIGGGYQGSCGTVTITDGVTSVTATKGINAQHSIGAGYSGSSGTVTIGGTEGTIETSPYTYQPSN